MLVESCGLVVGERKVLMELAPFVVDGLRRVAALFLGQLPFSRGDLTFLITPYPQRQRRYPSRPDQRLRARVAYDESALTRPGTSFTGA